MPASSDDHDENFVALLSKYDTALNLYDDLAKDISQMKKATQLVREKTLKLLETKVRRKRALSIQGDALDVVLSAGVKAQQRRKGSGARKLRRRGSTSSNHQKSPAKSPVKRRASVADKAAPSVGLKVHFRLPRK
ncbi:hypothetical protein H0H87_002695 [Tephrocybe sp. NHM501043]|nr:hypothetical protein H0H87_002695 [Tephrocybe sp. NHM501043]